MLVQSRLRTPSPLLLQLCYKNCLVIAVGIVRKRDDTVGRFLVAFVAFGLLDVALNNSAISLRPWFSIAVRVVFVFSEHLFSP